MPIVETEVHYSRVPWWRAVLYSISLGFLFIVILFYFILKNELDINLGMLGWLIIFGAFGTLYSQVRKVKFKKKDNGLGFYLVEETKKKSLAPPTNSKYSWTILQISRSFWARNKKILLFILFFVVFLMLGWNYHSQSKKRELACLKEIEYRSGNNTYKIEVGNKSQYFKTQDEAMNYCLKVVVR